MLVKLFGGLRKKAGASELRVPGETIRDVLEQICVGNNELGKALFVDDGTELRPHFRVMVNGVDSELKEGLDTGLNEDDQIAIFPPIAGG